MSDIIASFKYKKAWPRMFVSAFVFLLAAAPFKCLFSLIPGVTEIRPANAIPPVLGLLWGAPAAAGIAAGNLISDLLSGSSLFLCVTGFIINFLYGYIPYKLWYTFRVDEDKLLPGVDSVRKILKFIYVILMDSLVATALLVFVFEAAGFSSSAGCYSLFFFNNFDYAVLLGIPFLTFLMKYQVPCHLPKPEKESSFKKKKTFVLYQSALYLTCFMGAAWYMFSLSTGGNIHSKPALILLFISIFLMLSIVVKPICYQEVLQSAEKNRNIKVTIKTKVTFGFMLIASFFVGFVGVVALQNKTGKNFLELWEYMYLVIGLAFNAIFAVAILFLWYVEKNVVAPLELLEETAVAFAERSRDGDTMEAPKEIPIHTGDEIESLSHSVYSMMQGITQYMCDLKTITADKERIATELNVATQIQSSMLPCIFPAFPERNEFDIFAAMHPAKEVGGDFYDFFLIDYNHLAVVIADVSGKGVPAALFMVIAKTLIKNQLQSGCQPNEALEKSNIQLCEHNDAGMFVTAWAGILEINTGKFIYANAGHNAPLCRQGGGEFEYLIMKKGFVLAGMEEVKYKNNKLYLKAGDCLYLYTDGVTEAVDANNGMYEEERLKTILNLNKDKKPKELLVQVKKDVDEFVGGAPQFDDITMLALLIGA